MAPKVASAWRVVVGLGSNLGERLASLRAAADALDAVVGVTVCARSSVVAMPPAGGPRQPDYLNAALLLEVTLGPKELLEQTQQVERALGRIRPDPVRWGPRTIDIDLLWSPGLVLATPQLTLPHPRLAERPFALGPLLELAPDAADPITGVAYRSLDSARWRPRTVDVL
jgi:2-amino-4-hydroxy-6-hydroxymethyldihydropteridine diphosphokinase